MNLIISFIADLICKWFPDERPSDPYNCKERFGKVLRAGKKTRFLLVAFICMGLSGSAQVFLELAPGITNKYFSGELQVGYRYKSIIASAGYIAMPASNQPALFNVRSGVIIAERVLIYGGYVRTTFSSDNKSENSNNWQIGAQYHFMHYDRGTFYAGATYSHPNYTSVHFGMSWNLCKEDY